MLPNFSKLQMGKDLKHGAACVSNYNHIMAQKHRHEAKER